MSKKRESKSSLIMGIIAFLFSLSPFISFLIEGLLFQYHKLWYFYFLKYDLESLLLNGLWLGPLLGIFAIILSITQRKKKNKSFWYGLILGIISLALPIIYILILILGFTYLLITNPGGSW